MIGTFPASSPHLWPLLPSASLRLGCEISWVLRALHALPCLQGFARADSVWNSLLLFLLVILLACLGLDPVSPAWEPLANLLLISAAPAVTPGLCPRPLLPGAKVLSTLKNK